MLSVDEIRTHVLTLRRRGVRFVGHRAMLARLLDEIDALTAALREKQTRKPVCTKCARRPRELA